MHACHSRCVIINRRQIAGRDETRGHSAVHLATASPSVSTSETVHCGFHQSSVCAGDVVVVVVVGFEGGRVVCVISWGQDFFVSRFILGSVFSARRKPFAVLVNFLVCSGSAGHLAGSGGVATVNAAARFKCMVAVCVVAVFNNDATLVGAQGFIMFHTVRADGAFACSLWSYLANTFLMCQCFSSKM